MWTGNYHSSSLHDQCSSNFMKKQKLARTCNCLLEGEEEGGNQVKVMRREMFSWGYSANTVPCKQHQPWLSKLTKHLVWRMRTWLQCWSDTLYGFIPTLYQPWFISPFYSDLMSILITFLAWCFPAKKTYFRFLCYRLLVQLLQSWWKFCWWDLAGLHLHKTVY